MAQQISKSTTPCAPGSELEGLAKLQARGLRMAVRRTPVGRLSALVSVMVLFASGCNWAQFRNGASHTGFSQEEIVSVPRAAGMVEMWTGPTGGDVTSSPAVVDGTAYVGSVDGRLYAFSAQGRSRCSGSPKTCQPLWVGVTGGAVRSSPAVVGGTVFVGSDDQKLYAFPQTFGAQCSSVATPPVCPPRWASVTGLVQSPPVVANGIVYVGSVFLGGGILHAFDAAGITGCSGIPKQCSPLWTSRVGGILSSPAVAGGRVYVGTTNSKLAVFDANGQSGCSGTPKTCEPLWTTAAGNSVNSSPSVADGVVYFGSMDGKLYAASAAGTTGCSGTPKICRRALFRNAMVLPAVADAHDWR
jgi:serine/threonine-protein kinase